MTPITRPAHITTVAETGMAHHRQAAGELVASYRRRLAAGDDKVHASGAVVVACLAVMDQEETARTLAAAVVKLAEDHEELRDKRTDLLNIRGALSPNGRARRVPMELVPDAAPAVVWALDDRDRLRRELDEALAELERLRAVPGVAALTAPACPCRPNEAALHMKDCPVWVNVGPSLAQRQYVRRDSLTAEQADRAGVDRHWGPLATTGGDDRG